MFEVSKQHVFEHSKPNVCDLDERKRKDRIRVCDGVGSDVNRFACRDLGRVNTGESYFLQRDSKKYIKAQGKNTKKEKLTSDKHRSKKDKV